MPIALPLVALDVLVLVLWVIALASAIAVIMLFISRALGGLPWPLDKIAGPVAGLAKTISNAAYSLIVKTESFVGAAWHHLARYTDELWREVEEQSLALLHLAKVSGSHVVGITGFRSAIHALRTAITHTGARVGTITREITHLRARVKSLEHDLAKGIGADVLPKIRSLDRELTRVEHKVIPALRGEVATLEGDVTALGEYVRANFLANTQEAIAAAVAIGLGALGLGGLRCNTLLNSLRNRGCGLWGGLENLLGLFADLFFITNLCDLIGPLEEAFSVVAAPAIGELTAAIDEMPCVAGNQPPALAVPTLYTPATPLDLLAAG